MDLEETGEVTVVVEEVLQEVRIEEISEVEEVMMEVPEAEEIVVFKTTIVIFDRPPLLEVKAEATMVSNLTTEISKVNKVIEAGVLSATAAVGEAVEVPSTIEAVVHEVAEDPFMKDLQADLRDRNLPNSMIEITDLEMRTLINVAIILVP